MRKCEICFFFIAYYSLYFFKLTPEVKKHSWTLLEWCSEEFVFYKYKNKQYFFTIVFLVDIKYYYIFSYLLTILQEYKNIFDLMIQPVYFSNRWAAKKCTNSKIKKRNDAQTPSLKGVLWIYLNSPYRNTSKSKMYAKY